MDKNNFVVDKEALTSHTDRVFNASLDRLWEATTDPDQIKKWWGRGAMDIEEYDFKAGGKYRYVLTDDAGGRDVFFGEFREITPKQKTVITFEYEPYAGHVMVETATYEAVDDTHTRLVNTTKYASNEDMEGILQSGMQEGMNESYERLAKLVES